MKTPEQELADARAALEAETVKAADAVKALGAANDKLVSAEAEKAKLAEELSACKADAETAKAALAEAQGKLSASDAELSKLKAEAKGAEQRAAQICASVGVDPLKISGGSSAADGSQFSAMTDKQLMDHYGKISASEKPKFYAEHIKPRIK